MIKLETFAQMIANKLNENDCGIIFDVKADRNEYEEAKKNSEDFVVPGVVTALQGTHEPLQGIQVYYLPVMIECFGYAAMQNEFPTVPFTFEQQKGMLAKLVEDWNGQVVTVGDEGTGADAVFISGSTVTVGDVTNDNGGGYTRIPLLVSLFLTGIESAVFFNNQEIKIDGERVFFTEFFASLTRQGKSVTKVNTTTGKTLPSGMARIFSGTAYVVDAEPFTTIRQELLAGGLTDTHELTYEGTSFNVTFLEITVSGRIGSLLTLNVKMAEFFN